MKLHACFPEHVLQVKAELQEQINNIADPRKDFQSCEADICAYKKIGEHYKTICLLTEEKNEDESLESDEYIDITEYHKMWLELYECEKIGCNILNPCWVYDFLDEVIAAQNLPKYAYINEAEKKQLITKLFTLTEQLKRIYIDHKYDQKIITNNGYFSHGFQPVTPEGDIDTPIQPNKISFSEALDAYATSLGNDIDYAKSLKKGGDDVKSRMFIRHLARRNYNRYGHIKGKIIGVASWCIYGKYYPPSTIQNAFKN